MRSTCWRSWSGQPEGTRTRSGRWWWTAAEGGAAGPVEEAANSAQLLEWFRRGTPGRRPTRRDEGRCAFVGRGGRRRNSDHQVEMHHLDARALGGEATADNISLRCRQHNRYAAEQDFGRDHVAKKIAARRGGRR